MKNDAQGRRVTVDFEGADLEWMRETARLNRLSVSVVVRSAVKRAREQGDLFQVLATPPKSADRRKSVKTA